MNKFYQQTDVRVISLKERKEKREVLKKHFRKMGVPNYDFFLADLHKNPRRGCLESHLAVILHALRRGKKQIIIFEDDCLFKEKFVIPDMPSDWAMIYFGGNVVQVMEGGNKHYTRVSTWTTHAYMINLRNKELVKDILAMKRSNEEVDRFYMDKIHYKYQCYMITPMIAIQRPGYSDIEGKEVSYEFMPLTLYGLPKPKYEVKGTDYVLKCTDLKMENLPSVSLTTPTYNRRDVFSIALYNWNELSSKYPQDKIEWIICEDSDDEDKSVKDLIPNSHNVHYYDVSEGGKKTIGWKRNFCAEKASGEIIIHMDDDDFYPAESVISKVKILKSYENVKVLGSSLIPLYDMRNGWETIATDGTMTLSEGSMAYYKSFWEKRGFDDNCKQGEYFSFLEGRLGEAMDIPYAFTIIAISHGQNSTLKRYEDMEKKRVKQDGDENDTITAYFPEEFKEMVDIIGKRLKVKETNSVSQEAVLQ